MDQERSRYWASAHYVWRSDPVDILGEGAFGDVYRGFHKETCQYVAVKTFKKLNSRKPSDTQMREIKILERLNHPNVVKLIAIEDELSSVRYNKTNSQNGASFLDGKALIMEYCTEGNLYSIIEQAENRFGLDEAEMLRVLDHTTSGMKYLRENKIVHRDWKPSNILKTITDDGEVLYKLCDFGAARELDNDQAYLSIVGTEEYIAPDIYGRALLGRGSSSQSFSATNELWSYAVTVYHVITGRLPFRPFGGRTNRSTMYQIISEKPSGAISGVQEIENGPIKYSNALPDHCRLSKQCNKFLTYLLANLFEVGKKEESWTFDKFFDVVEEFLCKLRVNCATPSCQFSSWIYIDKSAGLVDFDKCIKNEFYHTTTKNNDRTTNSNMQSFYYLNAHLLDSSLWSGDKNSLQRLSAMSQKSPLLILLRSKDNGRIGQRPLPLEINFGDDDDVIDVSADYELANRCSSVTFWVLKSVKDELQRREMCARAAALLLSKIESSSSFLVEKVALLDRLLAGLSHKSPKSDENNSLTKKLKKTNEALCDVKVNLNSTIKNIKSARSTLPGIEEDNILTALDRFTCSIFETVGQFRHDRARYRHTTSENNDLKWHGLLKKQLKRTWLRVVDIYEKNAVSKDLCKFDDYFQELMSLNADMALTNESVSLVLEMITSLDNQCKSLVCENSSVRNKDSKDKFCYNIELQEIAKGITEIRSIHSQNRLILMESNILVDQMNTMLNVDDDAAN